MRHPVHGLFTFIDSSKPPASLTWRVNGREVTNQHGYDTSFGGYNSHDGRGYGSNNNNNKGRRKHRERGQSGRRHDPFPMPLVNKLIYTQWHFAMVCFQLNAELREYKPVEEADQLATSALGLSFTVQKYHLTTGLSLECSVHIGSAHSQRILENVQVTAKAEPSGGWKGASTSSANSKQRQSNKAICSCLYFRFSIASSNTGHRCFRFLDSQAMYGDMPAWLMPAMCLFFRDINPLHEWVRRRRGRRRRKQLGEEGERCERKSSS